MYQLFSRAKEAVIDAVFPDICICGKWGKAVCEDCQINIMPYRTQLCPVCKKISEDGKVCKKCYPKCYLTGLLVYGKHEGLLKDLVWRYKYEFIKGLGEYFGEILSLEFGPILIDKDCIITYVPSTRERERWRGFNQGEIVASEICARTNLPFMKLLRKIGNVSPQVGLSRKERIANLKGKIKVNSNFDIKNRRIVIIDDVYTTGSTLAECAKVLRSAGASEVWGLVISRE